MKSVPSIKGGHTSCKRFALISLRKPTERSTSAVVSEFLAHMFSVPVQRYEDVGKRLPTLPTQIWTGLEFHLFRASFSTPALVPLSTALNEAQLELDQDGLLASHAKQLPMCGHSTCLPDTGTASKSHISIECFAR